MNESLRTLIDLDRTIHEPARLLIVAILSAVESADFLYLLQATGLTKGNLSSHLSKLEEAGYVEIEKGYVGKVPRTLCRISNSGLEALNNYRQQMQLVIQE